MALFHYKQIYKSPKVARLIKPEYFKSEIHISLRSLRANVKINKLLPQVTKSGPKLLISTDLLKIRLFIPILRLRLPLPSRTSIVFRNFQKFNEMSIHQSESSLVIKNINLTINLQQCS